MSCEPRFVAAFAAASGGQTRLADLNVTIAACLTAHALNIGYSPIVKKGVRDEDVARLSPFVRHHLNVHGKYSFLLPEIPTGLRALRNPEDDD